MIEIHLIHWDTLLSCGLPLCVVPLRLRNILLHPTGSIGSRLRIIIKVQVGCQLGIHLFLSGLMMQIQLNNPGDYKHYTAKYT